MTRFTAQLSGAHILVTGGNKGIGRAVVESFLAEGANVSYCARSASEQDFVQYDGAIDGAQVTGTKLDVGDQAAVKSWVEASAEKYGRIDVVVANAYPFFPSSSIDDWKKSLDGNIIGLIALIEAVTPYLVARQGTGSFIVISSVGGYELRSSNPTGPQAVVKRSQAIIAKSNSKVLGQRGVRFNIVTPALVDTPNIILPDGTEQLSSFKQGRKLKPEFIQNLLDQVPMGRPGTAQEVANAVVFLGSPLSSYINGANLVIDGGFSVTF